jgi:branched-chain amino acid transport system substrate-binding protein
MKQEIKIGVLLPQSKQYTTLDRDFVRGIRLNDLNANLHIENIGIGSDEQIIIEKIQKLSLQEEISLFIGFFGHHNIQQVYQYASDNGIILIASDLGATLPVGSPKYDGVFINSFSMIESAHFLGKYFSENNYKNISSASSFYDAGYSFLAAIESSFVNNTNFAGHYITPLHPRENEAEIMEDIISACKPDAVFSFFSGLYAKENTLLLSKNKITTKYPFFMSPFSLDNGFIEDYKNNPHDIHIVTSWIENKTQQSKDFRIKYQVKYNDIPSIFSLLGYEIGLLFKTLFEEVKNKTLTSYKIEIENLSINGPRGVIQFDKETNRSFFDHHIYKMNLNADGNIIPEIIESFSNNGSFIKSVIKNQKNATPNGWHNAYLCH